MPGGGVGRAEVPGAGSEGVLSVCLWLTPCFSRPGLLLPSSRLSPPTLQGSQCAGGPGPCGHRAGLAGPPPPLPVPPDAA